MQKSLFVAGLEWSITSEELGEIFSAHGEVESAKVITDKFTGRSKGFGFVDMATAEDAANCIKNLNDTTHKNRQIIVKVKEPKPAGERSFRSNNNGGADRRGW
jgi:RNA recognition motif-containing protein